MKVIVLEDGIAKIWNEKDIKNNVTYKIEDTIIVNKDYNKIKPLVTYILKKNFNFETIETKILYMVLAVVIVSFIFLIFLYSYTNKVNKELTSIKQIVTNLKNNKEKNDNRKYIKIWGNTW